MRYRSPSFRYWTVNVGKSTSLIQIQTMGPQAPEKKGANAYATRKTTVQGVLNTAAITRTALMLKDYINDYESTPNTKYSDCFVLHCDPCYIRYWNLVCFHRQNKLGKRVWESQLGENEHGYIDLGHNQCTAWSDPRCVWYSETNKRMKTTRK